MQRPPDWLKTPGELLGAAAVNRRHGATMGEMAVICENAFVRTSVELPDDLFRKAKARAALQGQSLKDLLADGLQLLLQSPESFEIQSPAREATLTATPARKRASAGAWAKRFAGVARLVPGETTDDARMAHYREKYGV
ncbi:MAG TPA: hypothetical protein VIT91_07680 [Chthoniobacterales bacterium]